MTETSKSEASRFFIKGKNLRTDRSGLVEYYVGPLNHLNLALVDSEIAQHKGPGTRLTLTGVPTDKEIEDGDMSAFLKNLRLDSRGTVCALDISLRRNVEGWFGCSDSDQSPRLFEHIRKLYIRFPKEPEDQSPINEPEDQSPDEPKDQSPDEPKDQSPNESKDQSPKVSLEQVTQLLKDSLASDNRFPNLEELRIFGLDEDSILKAEAEENASIGRRWFMVLISGPETYYSARLESFKLCRKFERGPAGESIAYHVVTSRDSEDDSEDGIFIKWEKEKPKPEELLLQVPESNTSTGSPP